MPVPNSMADLAQLASANFPTGTESIGNNLDNYLRSGFAITRSTNAIASATIASASTTDIGSADAESVQVTGSATINSFGTGFAGCRREVRFAGAPVVVASSGIIIPGGANIAVSAGEVFLLRCTSPGVWAIVAGTRDITAVRKTGDTMSGPLAVNANVFAAGRSYVTEGSIGSIPSSGSVLFSQVLTASGEARVVAYNYTAVNAIPLVMDCQALRSTSGLQILGEGLLPAGAGAAVFHTGGYSSPVAGRTIFGDGSGWQYRWARRTGAVNIDVMTLDDSGNLTANNLTATSDESLKEHWEEISPSLVDGLASLLAGTYDRKDLKQRQVGVGAQSLQKIMPEAVYGDDLLSVNHGGAALVSAVALAKRLVALERRVYGAS